MAYRTCIFCNRNDSKPSREDVLAKWVARTLPNVRWEIIVEQTGKTSKQYPARLGTLGLISKRPCVRCNNTWMSALEQSVQRILTPLIWSHRAIITPGQQTLIVRWLIKTVILLDLLHGKVGYYDSQQCNDLMTKAIIPNHTYCFLAGYRGQSPDIIRLQGDPILFTESKSDPNAFSTFNGYAATILVNRLALQVFSIKAPDDGGKFRLTPRTNASRASVESSIQIWPSDASSSIEWPLPFVFDDRSLDSFVNRWLTVS